MNYTDKNGNIVSNLDIIDLHQTINGQSLYVVLNVKNLDIRYYHDLNRKYEYDCYTLLSNSTSFVEYEIVGKLAKMKLNQIKFGL